MTEPAAPATDALLAAARAWVAADPDPDTVAELEAVVGAASRGDEAARADLADRFAGRLQFGTAGLRGEIGAGPMRMNRVIVQRAAAGLGRYLLDTDEAARERGVVIGFDARRKSDVFALDTARVMAALGLRALLLPRPLPTPVLAFSVRHLGCAAGVMVTASHNPPQDNGYKVYLGDGSQIVAPADAEISACIDAVGEVALSSEDDPLVERLGEEAVHAYLGVIPTVRHRPDLTDVRVAYTAMHGVGRDVLLAAFERAGYPAPALVAAQADPDPAFPTVSFPNPEEPGAMDLLLAEAEARGADVALANDPDADRLAVAIPLGAGGWRALSGDETGWLLADHILRHTSGDDRLVVTTVVSSTMLARLAEAYGVQHRETYTGFKWIGRTVLDHPGLRFVFGYEQALGYLVTDALLDKDGITAAVVMAEVAALAKAEGTTVEARLADLAARFGQHRTAEVSVRLDPSLMGGLMDGLRADPPTVLAGEVVVRSEDHAEANLLRYFTESGARVQVRPSGTEPKVKLYGEAVGADPRPLLDALAARLTAPTG